MPELSKIYPDNLKSLALILGHCVRKMILDKGEYDLSRDPVLRLKPVISFHQRMRVDGMEKFNARTVFSAVKFYTDTENLERDKPLGALIVFIQVDEIARLMWSFDYPRIDEDDDAAILDACGTLTNLIAGYFLKHIQDLGGRPLQMSHFESHINTAVNGIAFASDEKQKYEVDFWIKGAKRLVAELTMGPVPPVNGGVR
jgi:hypothetical protein